MNAAEILTAMEPWFGYALADRSGLASYINDLLGIEDDDVSDEEIIGEQVERNVHWAAEGWSGESPAQIGWAARMKRLDVTPAPPMPPQTAELLARHWAGLYLFQAGKPFGDRRKEVAKGAWLVDLNPRVDDSREAVYYQDLSNGQLSPWFVLESPEQLIDCEHKFQAVRTAFEERPAKHAKAVKELLAAFPRVCRQMSDWFGKHGVPADKAPRSFADPSAPRLAQAHAALGPLAECVVRRAAGERRSIVSAKAAARAIEVAATAPDYPPHLLLALLAPALSDQREPAIAQAKRIVKGELGAPLTRRWAQQVLDGSLFN